MGLFLSAFAIRGLPDPVPCVAFRARREGDGPQSMQEMLSDMGVLSRRLGAPTALLDHPDLGQVVLAMAPVPFHSQSGVHGREYLTAGEVALSGATPDERRTVVRLVHQGLRDYMSSRSDFFQVGQNSYANSRPAAEDGEWAVHRRVTFRVDYPGPVVLAVDVGQMHVRREPLAARPGRPVPPGALAVLATPDGAWLCTVERLVEEVTVGDPVVVGPGGQRETLPEHYARTGMGATASAVAPTDHVAYLRRLQHGRPGPEEPHAASLVHEVARPDERPPFDPPPSARWRIVQGMANQLGRARLGAHELRLDIERPWPPAVQGVASDGAEVLRGVQRSAPTEERSARWDAERRTALKGIDVPDEAPRLGAAVLAHQEGVGQGAAAMLWSDVRYNLFRYLGTKADPRPLRTLEFSRAAELGALLATVAPSPSAVVAVADDPFAAYASAKSALPAAAVQAMSSRTLASRPAEGGEEGDASYFDSVLWLSTALEREAGRMPWSIEGRPSQEVHVGLSLMGRSMELGDEGARPGVVSAVDGRAGGALSVGGVVPLPEGRFEGEAVRAALASALGPCARRGPPVTVCFHREGSLGKPERLGLEAMVAALGDAGTVARGARANFVELELDHPYRIMLGGQTGPATCRAGSWAVLDERTALLATSGYPTKTRGTPEVLMLTARGGLPPADAARDAQLLGALDWGGREVRWPLTVWGPRAEMGVGRARPWG
jgi:hypothetical protein